MAVTLLDSAQVIQHVYDEPNNRLRVETDATVNMSGELEVAIDQVDDSIRIGDGVNLVTASVIASKIGLDVNVIGGVSGSFTSSGLSTGLRVQSIVVTDVATKLPSTSLTNRNALSMRVWGANTVYVGLSSVTASSGYPKRQFEEMVLDIKDNSNVDMYGICATGQSCEVRILELA